MAGPLRPTSPSSKKQESGKRVTMPPRKHLEAISAELGSGTPTDPLGTLEWPCSLDLDCADLNILHVMSNSVQESDSKNGDQKASVRSKHIDNAIRWIRGVSPHLLDYSNIRLPAQLYIHFMSVRPIKENSETVNRSKNSLSRSLSFTRLANAFKFKSKSKRDSAIFEGNDMCWQIYVNKVRAQTDIYERVENSNGSFDVHEGFLFDIGEKFTLTVRQFESAAVIDDSTRPPSPKSLYGTLKWASTSMRSVMSKRSSDIDEKQSNLAGFVETARFSVTLTTKAMSPVQVKYKLLSMNEKHQPVAEIALQMGIYDPQTDNGESLDQDPAEEFFDDVLHADFLNVLVNKSMRYTWKRQWCLLTKYGQLLAYDEACAGTKTIPEQDEFLRDHSGMINLRNLRQVSAVPLERIYSTNAIQLDLRNTGRIYVAADSVKKRDAWMEILLEFVSTA